METPNNTTGSAQAPATPPAVEQPKVAEPTPAPAAQVAPPVAAPPAAGTEEKPAPKPAETPAVKAPELFADVKQLKMPEGINDVEKGFLNEWLGKASKTPVDGKQPITAVQGDMDSKFNTFREVAAFGDSRIKAQQAEWDNSVKSDPKLGGDNLNRTSQLVERSLKTLFGDTFYESEVKVNFFFHHPEIVKGLVKFAEASGDSVLHMGEKPDPPKVEPKTIGEKAYGLNYDPMKVSYNS
jgi:hypothetical protein